MLDVCSPDRHSRPAGRAFTIYPDDTVLTSYPRSGSTWVRFILTALLEPDWRPDFTNISSVVPDIYKESDASMQRRPRPRMLKSHEPFDPRYARTIYLVRDPRDVALSYYHYLAHFRPQRDDGFADFLTDFLAGDMAYGSWADHVEGWITARGRDADFLLVRYEDLHTDAASVISEIASFADIRYDSHRILAALDHSSFQTMRVAEKKHLGEPSSDHSYFTRKGQRFGWKQELDRTAAARVMEAFGPAMTLVGYA